MNVPEKLLQQRKESLNAHMRKRRDEIILAALTGGVSTKTSQPQDAKQQILDIVKNLTQKEAQQLLSSVVEELRMREFRKILLK